MNLNELPESVARDLEKELYYAIYFLVNAGRFSLSDIMEMNLYDFTAYFEITRTAKEKEREEIEKLNQNIPKK